MRNWCRRRDVKRSLNQSGFMTAEWLVGFAFLLIPTFIIIFSLMQLPVRQNTTQVAAAAAARAYVNALDQSQALTQAKVAAAEAIADENSNCDSAQILSVINGGSTCGLSAHSIKVEVPPSIKYCPGQEVTLKVSMPVPVTINPFGGGRFNLGSLTSLSSSATERIDDYAELADSETGANPSFPYATNNEPCG